MIGIPCNNLLNASNFKRLEIDNLILKKIVDEFNFLLKKYHSQIIIMNGTSSVGKTTLANSLRKFGFKIINGDDILNEIFFRYLQKYLSNIVIAKNFLTDIDLLKLLHGFKIRENIYEQDKINIIKTLQKDIYYIQKNNPPPDISLIFKEIYSRAQVFTSLGYYVIIDMVIGKNFDLLYFYFKDYPIVKCLLYSSLDQSLRNCFQRNHLSSTYDLGNYRFPSLIINQYKDIYKFTNSNQNRNGDIILGEVNQNLLQNVLETAVYHEDKLLHYTLANIDKVSRKIHMKNLNNIIKLLKKAMMLQNFHKTFVTLAFEHDHVIESSILLR